MKDYLLRLTVVVFIMALAGAGALGAQTPTCGQVLTADCLYLPVTQYTFTEKERDTTYTDHAGLPRQVRVLVRTPVGALLPMPVVVWSHGGAEGKAKPGNSMVEWSHTTAEAGYLTISLAHPPRSQAERQELCQSLSISDPATCKVFKYLNWDRPHDIRAVLDDLNRMNAQGEFRGQIDLNKIAVGGHSAGAGGALSVAGAQRNFTGTAVDLADPRPVAFLAFSPQQPGNEGFFDTALGKPSHSWRQIGRPVLIGTGDGDNTCDRGPEPGSCYGDMPYGRRIAYERMPPGDKHQIYIHDADAFHVLFELNTDKCSDHHVNQQKCDEMARWLKSAALAFLAAHTRQDPLALQWLQSNNLEAASRGVAQWQRK